MDNHDAATVYQRHHKKSRPAGQLHHENRENKIGQLLADAQPVRRGGHREQAGTDQALCGRK